MEWWQIALLGLGILAALLVFAACWTGKMADKLSADHAEECRRKREKILHGEPGDANGPSMGESSIAPLLREMKQMENKNRRRGDWLQTFTGVRFYPLDPRPEELDIRDIAHALALQCRFAGHVREHYSVAEHCVRVSLVVPREDALWALLHDASEAYLVDLPRPLKNLPEFAVYRMAENLIMKAVVGKYGLAEHEPESVQLADDTLLATEARDLMGSTEGWAPMLKPSDQQIIPWGSKVAENAFLMRFSALSEEYTPGGAGIPPTAD